MATLPMSQPQNPNQASGASLTPMQYSAPATQLGNVASQMQMSTGTMQTGVGASTAGQPFGVPAQATTASLPGINTNQPSITSGLNISDGSKTLMGDFKDTYGAGTGSEYLKQLSQLGTAENTAFKATEGNVLMAANDQYSNILAQEAARGIDPHSSSHALAAGDFAAKVNANLADISGQMQLSGQQTLLSALSGEGQKHGSDVSGWETFADVLSGSQSAISAIAGGVSEKFGVGGTAGSILDIIGMM